MRNNRGANHPWLLLPLVIFLISLGSCASPKLLSYQSGGNDVAEIALDVHRDHKFVLHFQDLGERPPKKYRFKGSWQDKKESLYLSFRLDRKGLPDLTALFDPGLTEHQTVRVLDQQSVQFKKSQKTIYIWGVPCVKTEKR